MYNLSFVRSSVHDLIVTYSVNREEKCSWSYSILTDEIYIYREREKENIRSKEDDYIQEPITDNLVLLIFLNTSIKY